MLDFISAFELIGKLTHQIYSQVKMAKANPAQCQRLQERIQIVEAAMKPLHTLPPHERQSYEPALNDVVAVLTQALELVAKFSNKKTWFVEVKNAGTYHKKFASIALQLDQAIHPLNLGLNAQQLTNRQQDKQDQAKDQAALQAQQADILNLNQQLIEKTQQLQTDQQEGQLILLQQMASMKGKMLALLNQQATTSQTTLEMGPSKPPISPKYTVAFCDLLFDKKIGEGQLGKVYLGRWLEQPVAIKVLEGELTPEQTEAFIREVKIQSRLRSPRIVAFYAACLEPERACLVMEYCEQHALRDVLDNQQTLAVEQQQRLAHDIACGLYYLHQQGMVHRHLNSGNVLVDIQGHAKLADFGLAKISASHVKTAAQHDQAVAWLAPEVLRGQPHTTHSDIYSLGVILWELGTGQKPFAHKNPLEIAQDVLQGQRETIPAEIPQDYAALIQQCWAEQPEERPDALTLARAIEKIVIQPPVLSAETYYQQGLQFERDKRYEEAYQSYECAKSKGYYKAYTNIGTFFLTGIGKIPLDKTKAYEHFLVAAQQGHPRAMFNVGMMLEKGEGITADLNAALTWYEKTRSVYEKEGYLLEEVKRVSARMAHLQAQLANADSSKPSTEPMAYQC